jgi:3-oxoadipyl-CoA thiolase
MTDVMIADACRTPIGKLGGTLANVRPDDLAAHVMRRLVDRNPSFDLALLEDVYWGAANQAGEDNRNVGRIAALLAGLPKETAGLTVNRLCGSSLQSVISATHALKDGWGNAMIAGGSESMSRAPLVMLNKQREAFRPGAPEIADTTLGWRFVNPAFNVLYRSLPMGGTAEEVAHERVISREDQDAFAFQSHQRALGAMAEGRLESQIESIEAPQDIRGRTSVLVAIDEGPRADTSLEKLASLRPVFRKEGSVTAGNASQMNDGAAALLMVTQAGLDEMGSAPMARVVSSAVAGVHPDVMGLGPIPASRKALQRAGLTVADLDLVELNEAFASQALACMRELDLDPAKVNVNGGAIANGHPLGASGAKILTTLLYELQRTGGRYGLATMCIGVGQGIAVVVEAL